MKTLVYSFIICLITLTLTNCATTPKNTDSSTEMIKALNKAVDEAFENVETSSRIAVIHIQTTSNDMNNFILDELQHILVRRRYSVVDRVDLDKIRQERDFQYSFEVDDNTAVSVGKFVGADLVVTGGISGTNPYTRLRLKAIDTQTTIIKGTASVTLEGIKLDMASQPPPADATPPRGTTPSPREATPPRDAYAQTRKDTPKYLSLVLFGSAGIDGSNETCKELDIASEGSYNLGLALSFKLGKLPLILEPGARYTFKTITIDNIFSNVPGERYSQNIYNYVDAFAKAKLHIPLGSSVSIQPFAGYANSFLISATGSFKAENYESEEFDIAEKCNLQLQSVMMGLDFVINDAFFIGGEYDMGLSNIWKEDQTEIIINTWLVNLGFKF